MTTTAQDVQTESEQAAPEQTESGPGLKECDLVMKGGITSGLVYPKVVLALKDTYRFRCIGGTSAGAIAAVASAAAEFNRDGDGFERLGALNDALCAQGFLRSLFRPSPRTAALMDVASAAMQSKSSRWVAVRVLRKVGGVLGALARNTAWELAAGAAAGVGVGWGLSALDGGTAAGARRGVFLGLYGALGALVGAGWALLRKLFRDLPDNGFGICIGHDPQGNGQGKGTGADPGSAATGADPGKATASGADPQAGGAGGPHRGAGGPVLIDWLIGQIEGIGGKTAWATVEDGLPGAGRRYKVPLTFGDLAACPAPIFLKMMTTNVSEELPYVLPFGDHRFLFEEAVMRQYFPGDVVDHLVARRHRSDRGVQPPPGFFFLPSGDDLPIVVAMRMSLSFPVLLSAVPLWTLGPSAFARLRRAPGAVPGTPAAALTRDDLIRNWFSDGGLSSNFPIQFFDSWLPVRPTFGIDLTPYPPEAFGPDGKLQPQKFAEALPAGDSTGRAAPRAAADPAAPVYLPRANEHPPRIVNDLPGLVSFLGAIVSTMQNFRDNQQAQLPSYRERIVQVRLEKTEGGLNLDMPAETLARIADKGSDAGRKLLTDFAFDEHQWTRFLVVMSQLEAELREMQARVCAQTGAAPAAGNSASGSDAPAGNGATGAAATGPDAPTGPGTPFDVAALLQRQQAKGFPYGYPVPSNPQWAQRAQEWVDNVQKVLGEIDGLMQAWPQPPSIGTHPLFERSSPRPPSNLRLMPQLYAPLGAGPAAPPPVPGGAVPPAAGPAAPPPSGAPPPPP